MNDATHFDWLVLDKTYGENASNRIEDLMSDFRVYRIGSGDEWLCEAFILVLHRLGIFDV